MYKAPDPPFPQIHFANKDNSSYIWEENLITANTLTLLAVMNRASHIRGFWFIFLTFCMQRRRVLYDHNVTRQKTRSGLWENKLPSFSSSVMSPLFCLAVAAFILLSTGSLRCLQLKIHALMSGSHVMFWLKAETESIKWHLSYFDNIDN